MAIQEIDREIIGSAGFEKKIDEGAKNMVFDILQSTQYQKPEESTIRELTSNAVDSQKEKEIALKILQGDAKVEDYYIDRTGDKYKDSNFDADYYDINHLDLVNNQVQLTYNEHQGTGYCDRFTIKDYGVGIGDSRLEGVLSLGYSTKRNSKAALGAWGLGAKVALSLRGDYYAITTVHNGRKFKAHCYAYKTDFLVSKFNMETEEENQFIEFSDGTKVYYEETNEKNYTEVTVLAKRHHRNKFMQGVQSQLLYFDNVKFDYVYEDETVDNIEFLADIMYNSKNIIISHNNQFSKPHIVIVKEDSAESSVGVCYGYIDFTELELENLNGNIGIKCPIRSVIRDKEGNETVLQEGVSVTPSRESVIWDENTREFIKNRFNAVVEEASNIISQELLEDDFLLWIEKCQNIMRNQGQGSILSRMAKVVDTSKIKPSFPNNKLIKYENPMSLFFGFTPRVVSSSYNSSKKKDLVSRNDITSWHNFSSKNVWFKSGSTMRSKDVFIAQNHGPFVLLEDRDIDDYIKSMMDKEDKDDGLMSLFDKVKPGELQAKYNAIKEVLFKSDFLKNYDDLEVSPEWKKRFEKSEELANEFEEERERSNKDRRALEGKVVAHELYFNHDRAGRAYSSYHDEDKIFSFRSVEPKINEIEEWEENEATIYYGFSDDTEKIHTYYNFIRSFGISSHDNIYAYKENYHDDNHKVFKISKANKRHFENFSHIDRAFKQLNGNIITMDNKLIKWNTARLINDQLDKLEFFYNFTFNVELQELYKDLVKYRDLYYTEMDTNIWGARGKWFDSIVDHMNKVEEFQLFVIDHEDSPEAIQEKATQMFSLPMLTDGCAIEMEQYNILQQLLEYAEPIYFLFNDMSILTNNRNITQEQEVLLKEILDLKHRKYN